MATKFQMTESNRSGFNPYQVSDNLRSSSLKWHSDNMYRTSYLVQSEKNVSE